MQNCHSGFGIIERKPGPYANMGNTQMTKRRYETHQSQKVLTGRKQLHKATQMFCEQKPGYNEQVQKEVMQYYFDH